MPSRYAATLGIAAAYRKSSLKNAKPQSTNVAKT